MVFNRNRNSAASQAVAGNRGLNPEFVRCLRCSGLNAQSDRGTPFAIFRCADCGYTWTVWKVEEWLTL